MKKLLLKFLFATVLISGTFFAANAQEFGVRFGDVSGGNIAIDAVFSTYSIDRIHTDISFGHGVAVDVLWDFIYRPLGDEALNWYAGVGPYVWFYDPFQLGAVGEIGVEYLFDAIPVSLSADWRPAVSVIEETDFHAGGFGLNIRYIF